MNYRSYSLHVQRRGISSTFGGFSIPLRSTICAQLRRIAEEIDERRDAVALGIGTKGRYIVDMVEKGGEIEGG
jgi:hypothetical protein